LIDVAIGRTERRFAGDAFAFARIVLLDVGAIGLVSRELVEASWLSR